MTNEKKLKKLFILKQKLYKNTAEKSALHNLILKDEFCFNPIRLRIGMDRPSIIFLHIYISCLTQTITPEDSLKTAIFNSDLSVLFIVTFLLLKLSSQNFELWFIKKIILLFLHVFLFFSFHVSI